MSKTKNKVTRQQFIDFNKSKNISSTCLQCGHQEKTIIVDLEDNLQAIVCNTISPDGRISLHSGIAMYISICENCSYTVYHNKKILDSLILDTKNQDEV